MAAFDVKTDPGSGILCCRIYRFLSDEEVQKLAAALLATVTAARRRHGTIRLLFDNRLGAVFSAKAAEMLVVLRDGRNDRDKTAVLVSDSINKLQTKRTAGPCTKVFMSEADAMAWLAVAD